MGKFLVFPWDSHVRILHVGLPPGFRVVIRMKIQTPTWLGATVTGFDFMRRALHFQNECVVGCRTRCTWNNTYKAVLDYCTLVNFYDYLLNTFSRKNTLERKITLPARRDCKTPWSCSCQCTLPTPLWCGQGTACRWSHAQRLPGCSPKCSCAGAHRVLRDSQSARRVVRFRVGQTTPTPDLTAWCPSGTRWTAAHSSPSCVGLGVKQHGISL